jgi:hypothetical protein
MANNNNNGNGNNNSNNNGSNNGNNNSNNNGNNNNNNKSNNNGNNNIQRNNNNTKKKSNFAPLTPFTEEQQRVEDNLIASINNWAAINVVSVFHLANLYKKITEWVNKYYGFGNIKRWHQANVDSGRIKITYDLMMKYKRIGQHEAKLLKYMREQKMDPNLATVNQCINILTQANSRYLNDTWENEFNNIIKENDDIFAQQNEKKQTQRNNKNEKKNKNVKKIDENNKNEKKIDDNNNNKNNNDDEDYDLLDDINDLINDIDCINININEPIENITIINGKKLSSIDYTELLSYFKMIFNYIRSVKK